jgi:hypothetical protein
MYLSGKVFLPNMCKALGSIASTARQKQKEKKREKDLELQICPASGTSQGYRGLFRFSQTRILPSPAL